MTTKPTPGAMDSENIIRQHWGRNLSRNIPVGELARIIDEETRLPELIANDLKLNALLFVVENKYPGES